MSVCEVTRYECMYVCEENLKPLLSLIVGVNRLSLSWIRICAASRVSTNGRHVLLRPEIKFIYNIYV